jgi:hypothetical protein
MFSSVVSTLKKPFATFLETSGTDMVGAGQAALGQQYSSMQAVGSAAVAAMGV